MTKDQFEILRHESILLKKLIEDRETSLKAMKDTLVELLSHPTCGGCMTIAIYRLRQGIEKMEAS